MLSVIRLEIKWNVVDKTAGAELKLPNAALPSPTRKEKGQYKTAAEQENVLFSNRNS